MDGLARGSAAAIGGEVVGLAFVDGLHEVGILAEHRAHAGALAEPVGGRHFGGGEPIELGRPRGEILRRERERGVSRERGEIALAGVGEQRGQREQLLTFRVARRAARGLGELAEFVFLDGAAGLRIARGPGGVVIPVAPDIELPLAARHLEADPRMPAAIAFPADDHGRDAVGLGGHRREVGLIPADAALLFDLRESVGLVGIHTLRRAIHPVADVPVSLAPLAPRKIRVLLRPDEFALRDRRVHHPDQLPRRHLGERDFQRALFRRVAVKAVAAQRGDFLRRAAAALRRRAKAIDVRADPHRLVENERAGDGEVGKSFAPRLVVEPNGPPRRERVRRLVLRLDGVVERRQHRRADEQPVQEIATPIHFAKGAQRRRAHRANEPRLLGGQRGRAEPDEPVEILRTLLPRAGPRCGGQRGFELGEMALPIPGGSRPLRRAQELLAIRIAHRDGRGEIEDGQARVGVARRRGRHHGSRGGRSAGDLGAPRADLRRVGDGQEFVARISLFTFREPRLRAARLLPREQALHAVELREQRPVARHRHGLRHLRAQRLPLRRDPAQRGCGLSVFAQTEQIPRGEQRLPGGIRPLHELDQCGLTQRGNFHRTLHRAELRGHLAEQTSARPARDRPHRIAHRNLRAHQRRRSREQRRHRLFRRPHPRHLPLHHRALRMPGMRRQPAFQHPRRAGKIPLRHLRPRALDRAHRLNPRLHPRRFRRRIHDRRRRGCRRRRGSFPHHRCRRGGPGSRRHLRHRHRARGPINAVARAAEHGA